jgi:hypothetical protein
MTNAPNLTAPSAEPTGTNIVSASTLAGATLTDKMNALAGGKELSLPTKVYADRDCNRPSNYAVYDYFLAKPAAIHGSGADKSVLSLPPNSLSQNYKKIDSIVEPDTNPYYLLRVDGAKVVENIGVKGSDQGTSPVKGKKYSFHGIQLYQTVNPTLKKLHITDISGPDPVPPNETFAVFGYNISGTYTCEDILIDAPTLPGSSGISCMAKGTLAVILKRIKVTGHPNGNGWTIFNSTLSKFYAEDFATDGSMSGLNFEQANVAGGAKVNNAKDSGIVLVRPDIRNPSGKISGYSHLSIDSSAAGGGVSNRVDIHDPAGIDTSHKFGVCISSSYGYANVPKGAQAQRGADIHLWMGSTERNDLLWFTRTRGAA